ncbi:MAG: hypothetical protein E6H55_15110 [Betaproteobacteria bacterium]|nr:MAG: hypothetical protein E6H55_15110 [Betaproteobacteria bacterium]
MAGQPSRRRCWAPRPKTRDDGQAGRSGGSRYAQDRHRSAPEYPRRSGSGGGTTRWQATEFAKHTGARINVDAPETGLHIDRDIALALFRIFQETLTNVARHAQATEVAVKLSSNDDALILRIRDNGVGLSEHDLRKPTSLGIRGMRERARQLGGDISVSAEPGSGTTVIISIPSTKRAS